MDITTTDVRLQQKHNRLTHIKETVPSSPPDEHTLNIQIQRNHTPPIDTTNAHRYTKNLVEIIKLNHANTLKNIKPEIDNNTKSIKDEIDNNTQNIKPDIDNSS